MAHECPDCGQACYCDIEDVWNDSPDDCSHVCNEAENDEQEYACECYYVDVDVVDSHLCPLHARHHA